MIELIQYRNLALVIVGVLGIIQVPLDLRHRILSRRLTMLALYSLILVFGVDAVKNQSWTTLSVASIAAIAVTSIYALLHRVSPQSLGWGDVLLVAPLTLAVAYVAPERVLWWQLLAASTGAVHAVWVRIQRGSSHVPFGPHLLIAAWLMMVASV